MASMGQSTSQSETFEMEDMTISNTHFTSNFLRCDVFTKANNFVCAPHGVAGTLGMAYMGARGTTLQEMKQVLKWSADVPPKGFGSSLSSLKKTAEKKTGSTLLEAQCICVDRSFTLKHSFTSDIEQHFGDQVVRADFRNNPEDERKNINGWMQERMQGMTGAVLPEGSIDSSTCMVLAQGTSLNAQWLHKFTPRNTRRAVFHTPNRSIYVHMMKQTGKFRHWTGTAGNQYVEIPFVTSRLSVLMSMVIILPPEGMERPDNGDVGREDSPSSVKMVKLSLPRFTVETTIDLTSAMAAQGMPRAFGSGADFSGMVEDGDLSISTVHQTVKVTVNEEGVGVQERPGRQRGQSRQRAGSLHRHQHPAVPFNVNHPFDFFVVGKGNGTNQPPNIIFGRVVNPLD